MSDRTLFGGALGWPRVLRAAIPWVRPALLTLLGLLALGAFAVVSYQLALARIPRHRAALERLVRTQTGLDMHFSELGLRWGWYGPEAVFRRVELDAPGSTALLLRAPELVVGFDAWRTLRSGHPEADRIELIAPDIDLTDARPMRHEAASRDSGAAVENRASGAPAALDQIGLLKHWRGGRLDIDGGSLRLPDPTGGTGLFTLQIRRASLRRSQQDWSVSGLVFLPDRIGHTARITLAMRGDPADASSLQGSLRVDVRRLSLAGCRELLAGNHMLARYFPSSGSGDASVELSFEHGSLRGASGSVRMAGVTLSSTDSSIGAGAVAALSVVDRVRAHWQLEHSGALWHLDVDSLSLGREPPQQSAFLSLDADASTGRIQASITHAPLAPVVAVAQSLRPKLLLAGADLDGSLQRLIISWDPARPEGTRLVASAQVEKLTLAPPTRDFVLSGLDASVLGSESQLRIGLQASSARLAVAASQPKALSPVRVAAVLHVSDSKTGWRLTTDAFVLEHARARLRISGTLRGASSGAAPVIAARGALVGADIPLIESLLGSNTAATFGAVASQLTAGQMQNAEFVLRGALSQLPFGDHAGFSGALTLRGANLSGGDLWPDVQGIEAHIEWRGSRMQATIAHAQAGPFEITAARAQWDPSGQGPTRIAGHVNGRLEQAMAWMRAHPKIQEYAPRIQEVEARGNATFDFNVIVPAQTAPVSGVYLVRVSTHTDVADPTRFITSAAVRTTPAKLGSATILAPAAFPQAPGFAAPAIQSHVSMSVDGAELRAIAGLPPIQALHGAVVFESGHLQRSTLTGTWLGGPLTLRLGERREQGARALTVQAQGILNAHELADIANVAAIVQGTTAWAGELSYFADSQTQPSHWRMRVDSGLVGVLSSLPEPLEKRPGSPLPSHLELAGNDESALLQLDVSERMRAGLELRRNELHKWVVARGAVQLGTGGVDRGVGAAGFGADAAGLGTSAAGLGTGAAGLGTGAVQLPSEPVLLIQGRLTKLDLPAYAWAWRSLPIDSVPAVKTELAAASLLLGEQAFGEVQLHADRSASASRLAVDSPAIQGFARWSSSDGTDRPVELHLTRLAIADGGIPSEGLTVIAALADQVQIQVQELSWRSRKLGALSARFVRRNDTATLNDLQLTSGTQQARGSLRCDPDATCQLTFSVESQDAARTLLDFGFRPDIAARQGTLSGTVHWRLTRQPSWLASLQGTVRLSLLDGAIRRMGREDEAEANAPFALLSIPALVGGLDADATSSESQRLQDLNFVRLQADFAVRNGEARTSNLYFDGDAEILVRGRTGLLAHDYDQQVWVLKGEDKLPSAVRRFGAAPRVAEAWLSLRDLLTGHDNEDRSRAVLRLQGSWDDPMVVAAR